MTYKQKLLDLIQDEIKELNRSKSTLELLTLNRNSLIAFTDILLRVTRLTTYKLQIMKLPAKVVASSKSATHRHPVINSIYLFKPELIDKLYTK